VKKFISIVFLSFLISPITYAQSARDIVQQANDRDDGKSQFSRQTIATCKYAIKDRRISCVESPRRKTLEAVSKDYGKRGKDKKSVMIILEPPSERGIGFLQFDYDEAGKDSDQWMYLSALGKVKRVVSGDEDAPKTGTLFGSEFSYEDTEQRHIDDFTYTIVKEESYQGRDCWVIESRPTASYARKSNYSRSEQWIDKERLLMLKANMYDRRGQLIKQMVQTDFVQQDGIWIARKMNMNNVQSQRISTMKLENIALNIPVEDQLMSQRTLTDGVFREQRLSTLRSTK